MNAPGWPLFWCPFTLIYLKVFGLELNQGIFLRAHVPIADNFWRNSFECGNLSFPLPYMRLFQWLLSAPHRFAPLVPARLARPVDRPWFHHILPHSCTWNVCSRCYWSSQFCCWEQSLITLAACLMTNNKLSNEAVTRRSDKLPHDQPNAEGT